MGRTRRTLPSRGKEPSQKYLLSPPTKEVDATREELQSETGDESYVESGTETNGSQSYQDEADEPLIGNESMMSKEMPIKDFLQKSVLGWYCVVCQKHIGTEFGAKKHLTTKRHEYLFEGQKTKEEIKKEYNARMKDLLEKKGHPVKYMLENGMRTGKECSVCQVIFDEETGDWKQHEKKTKCFSPNQNPLNSKPQDPMPKRRRGTPSGPHWISVDYIQTSCFAKVRVPTAIRAHLISEQQNKKKKKEYESHVDSTNSNTSTSPEDINCEVDHPSLEPNALLDNMSRIVMPKPSPKAIVFDCSETLFSDEILATPCLPEFSQMTNLMMRYTADFDDSRFWAPHFVALADVLKMHDTLIHAYIAEIMQLRRQDVETGEPDAQYITLLQELGCLWLVQRAQSDVMGLLPEMQYCLGFRSSHPNAATLDFQTCPRLPSPLPDNEIGREDEQLRGFVSFCWRLQSDHLDKFKERFRKYDEKRMTEMLDRSVFQEFLTRINTEDQHNPLNARSIGRLYGLSLCFSRSSVSTPIVLERRAVVASRNIRFLGWMRTAAAALANKCRKSADYKQHVSSLLRTCREGAVSSSIMLLVSDCRMQATQPSVELFCGPSRDCNPTQLHLEDEPADDSSIFSVRDSEHGEPDNGEEASIHDEEKSEHTEPNNGEESSIDDEQELVDASTEDGDAARIDHERQEEMLVEHEEQASRVGPSEEETSLPAAVDESNEENPIVLYQPSGDPNPRSAAQKKWKEGGNEPYGCMFFSGYASHHVNNPSGALDVIENFLFPLRYHCAICGDAQCDGCVVQEEKRCSVVADTYCRECGRQTDHSNDPKKHVFRKKSCIPAFEFCIEEIPKWCFRCWARYDTSQCRHAEGCLPCPFRLRLRAAIILWYAKEGWKELGFKQIADMVLGSVVDDNALADHHFVSFFVAKVLHKSLESYYHYLGHVFKFIKTLNVVPFDSREVARKRAEEERAQRKEAYAKGGLEPEMLVSWVKESIPIPAHLKVSVVSFFYNISSRCLVCESTNCPGSVYELEKSPCQRIQHKYCRECGRDKGTHEYKHLPGYEKNCLSAFEFCKETEPKWCYRCWDRYDRVDGQLSHNNGNCPLQGRLRAFIIAWHNERDDHRLTDVNERKLLPSDYVSWFVACELNKSIDSFYEYIDLFQKHYNKHHRPQHPTLPRNQEERVPAQLQRQPFQRNHYGYPNEGHFTQDRAYDDDRNLPQHNTYHRYHEQRQHPHGWSNTGYQPQKRHRSS